MTTIEIKERFREDFNMQMSMGLLRFCKTIFDNVDIDEQTRLVIRFEGCSPSEPTEEYRFWKLFYDCFPYLFAPSGGEMNVLGDAEGGEADYHIASRDVSSQELHPSTPTADPSRANPEEGRR